MENEVKWWCKHCDTQLTPGHTGPCPKCGKSEKRFEYTIVTSMGHSASLNSRTRQKGKGFKKFKKEIEQGHFSSGDPKLKNGVEKVRIIDRENDKYDETTIDTSTGIPTRDIHVPLSQHKSKAQQRK